MRKQLMSFLLILAAAASWGQAPRTVKLKATSGKTVLRHVFINKVADDRADTSNIGMIRTGVLNKQAPVSLYNGTTGAIKSFIEAYVQQDQGKDPIELHVLQLKVTEKSVGLKEQADLSTQFGFFKNGKKIIDYSGTSYIQSGMDVSPYIGRLVSQSLENVLKEFDGWWAENRSRYDDSRQEQIRVTVARQQQSTDPDQLVFNSNAPLRIEDFQGTPDELSIALAATYSGFSVQYESKGDHTGTTVTVTVLPYFDRTKSWMKERGKTTYVLLHEQQHFNITAIKTLAFIEALKNFPFTVAGFKEEISMLQKQYGKELEQMQAQYDQETKHGTLKDKQKLWETRIRTELNAQLSTANN
jgi:hypothetical protein